LQDSSGSGEHTFGKYWSPHKTQRPRYTQGKTTGIIIKGEGKQLKVTNNEINNNFDKY